MVYYKEKRRSTRVRPDPASPIEVQIIGVSFLEVLHARNICIHGMGIFVPHRFEGYNIDSCVELIITLPQGRPFKAIGKIRHEANKSKSFFGVEFVELDEKDRQAIAQYVELRKEG